MIDIIYEDGDILAVNKPPFLVVYHEDDNEESSLSDILLREHKEIKNIGGKRNGAVHRLDKDTSGIVLFAKNEETLSFLQNELLEKRAEKRYITLVFRNPKEESGEIHTFIDRSLRDRKKQRAHTDKGGKREAITFFKVIKDFENYSLLEVFPKTGRKHQIRCHLAYIGHPVVGDKVYRFKDQKDPKGIERQFLHAESIEIMTPKGKIIFKAELAEDLKKILEELK
jgi:23S rRNA pseudouridine1911/1915/1917 synthase